MRTPLAALSALSLTLCLSACSSREVDPPPPPCFDCCEDGFDSCHPPPFPEIDPSRSLPPLSQAETPPPPLSGGTLLVSGERAIIADPDTDRVHLVTLEAGASPELVTTTALEEGDEPGRVIEDAFGSYYVALRSGGAVARFDAELNLEARYDVCSSPRGIATFGTALYVACLEGDLVTIDTETGEEVSRREVGADLRDLVVTTEHIYVSHFRAATVSVLPREGEGAAVELVIDAQEDSFMFRGGLSAPSVAYRMIAHQRQVVVLHQLARSEEPVQISSSGGYGGGGCAPSLVQAGLTVIDGTDITNTSALGNLVLPVDVAISVDGRVMIAAAGNRTDDPTVTFIGGGGGAGTGADAAFAAPTRAPAVAESSFGVLANEPFVPLGCNPGIQYEDGRRATAVGFTEDGRTAILTRAPTQLHLLDSDEYVELGGPEVYDVGHELFFGDTGAGIACASCHAEGGDDGLVWNFEEIGRRRTQELRGGILGTEPFHWDGDMADFRHLAQEVFSGRMLGPDLPDGHADALAEYIDTMQVPDRGDHVDPLAAERGRAIFDSAEAQCSLCHGGPRLTTPGNFDVGTGGPFQAPSLIGVGLRAPFLHTGCADTLEERFSPDCGGETHGRVEHLATEELADLIAYLESV